MPVLDWIGAIAIEVIYTTGFILAIVATLWYMRVIAKDNRNYRRGRRRR